MRSAAHGGAGIDGEFPGGKVEDFALLLDFVILTLFAKCLGKYSKRGRRLVPVSWKFDLTDFEGCSP